MRRKSSTSLRDTRGCAQEISKEIYGWQNIELISDRSFDVWIDEFKKVKDKYPSGIVIASIMEEYNKDRWIEIVERTQATGVAAFELNSPARTDCPSRKMGSAMGQDCALMEEVCGWVMSATKIPVWAKLTPERDAYRGWLPRRAARGLRWRFRN